LMCKLLPIKVPNPVFLKVIIPNSFVLEQSMSCAFPGQKSRNKSFLTKSLTPLVVPILITINIKFKIIIKYHSFKGGKFRVDRIL
jgi:hypothetical protein